jgi:hypothetical protein
MDKSFLINLLFYFFSIIISCLLISILKIFPICVGSIIFVGSVIGLIFLIISYFKKDNF